MQASKRFYFQNCNRLYLHDNIIYRAALLKKKKKRQFGNMTCQPSMNKRHPEQHSKRKQEDPSNEAEWKIKQQSWQELHNDMLTVLNSKKSATEAIYSCQNDINTVSTGVLYWRLISSTFAGFNLPHCLFYVCVSMGEQAPCLLHLDLNTALKLHSCERPAALPGYPNTMCSICRPLHKARTVFQLLFSLCEDQPAGLSYPQLMPLRSKREKENVN